MAKKNATPWRIICFLPLLALGAWLAAPAPADAQEVDDSRQLLVPPPHFQVVVDGDPREWEGIDFARIRLENLPVAGPPKAGQEGPPTQIQTTHNGSWQGAGDLSGWIGVAVDASALYIFGRVRDDHLIPPPPREREPWHFGDVVEIFLDTDPEDGDTQTFSDDDYQIFLFPGNLGETAWGVSRKGQPWVYGDANFEGVEVVFRRAHDGTGYTFEARFPLVNFPHLKNLADGYRIGFNVALGDREPSASGENEALKYVYMTWNGKGELWMSPGRFGTLQVHDPDDRLGTPPLKAPQSSGVVFILMLVGAFGVLAFLVVWLVQWIAGWPLRRKVVAATSLGMALALVFLAGWLVRLLSDRLVEERVAETAKTVREVLAAVQDDTHLDRRLDLLKGLGVSPKKKYAYTYFRLSKPGTVSRPSPGSVASQDGTPVYLGDWTGLEVRRAPPTVLHLAPEETGELYSLIVSAARRPGLDRKLYTPAPDRVVAHITLSAGTASDAARSETAICVDARGDLCVVDAEQGVTTLNRFALSGHADRHVYEVNVPGLPRREGEPAPDRLVLTTDDDVFVISVHGVSVRRQDRWKGVPFRIDSRASHPLELIHGAAGRVVSARKAWSEPLAIGQPLDRLWLYFKCANGFPHGSPLRTRVAEVVLRYVGGKKEIHPLSSGVHLESYRHRREKHSARMLARVALNGVWDREPGGRPIQTRLDVLAIAPGAGRKSTLESVEMRWHEGCAGPERITLVAVTGGLSTDITYSDAFMNCKALDHSDRGEIQLAADFRETLTNFRITASVMPVVAGDEPRREGREVAAYIPLGNVSGVRLAMDLAPIGLIEGARRWTGVALLIALLPVLLVLAADALGRSRRLRVKLLLAIAVASMPPLALLVVYLDDEIAGHLDLKAEARARVATEQVAAAVQRARNRVETIAREIAGDRGLRAMLDREGTKDFDSKLRRRLAGLEERWPEDTRDKIEVLLSDTVLQRVHRRGREDEHRAHAWLAPQVDRSGLYSHYGSVAAVGFEPVRTKREPQRWNLCVVHPLTTSFFDTLFRDDPEVHAFAFLPGTGFPYAGIKRDGADARFEGCRDARITGLQAAADPGQGVVRVRPLNGVDSTVGARILHDAMEEPVLAVGAAVNRVKAFELRGTVREQAMIAGAAMLLLFVIVTFLVTRRMVDPLVSLSRAARRLAAGKEDVPPVPVAAPDEVGKLTAAFNDMAGKLRKRLEGLDLLNAGMRDLNASRTVDAILETVVTTFESALDPTTIVLGLHDPEQQAFLVLGGRRNGRPIEAHEVPAEGSFLLSAMQTGRPECTRALRWMELSRDERRLYGINDGEGPDQVVTLPLDYQGDPIGVIVLAFGCPAGGGRSTPVDPDTLLVLATMSGQIAGALENARLYRLAVEDPLTGLLLQGYFESRLKDEIQRAARHGRTVALIKLQVEETPVVASRHGPVDAAALLKTISASVRTVLGRKDAFAARLDDNQFAIVLAEAERRQAVAIAQQLADALLAHPFAPRKGRPIQLTPRYAVAVYPDDAGSFSFLVRETDRALESAEPAEAASSESEAAPDAAAEAAVFDDGVMVLRSPRTLALVQTVKQMAASDVTVLLTGETGTGKEVFAQLIHRESERRDQPLVTINCAALPELLLESELFGHERGAFTGAHKRKQGRFELAHGGTLFLDEIGDISASTQVKLLRVLQEKKIERLGGTESINLDVRIITATNHDMLELVRVGDFREDLFYRLNVFSIEIPPLRERKEEIPSLSDFFIKSHNEARGTRVTGLHPQALDRLFEHDWPGNIRELKNVLERALVGVGAEGLIEPEHLTLPTTARSRRGPPRTSAGRAAGDAAPARREAQTEPGAGPPAAGDPSPGHTHGPGDDELEALVANPRQMELLRYLRRKNAVTNQEYVAMMNISPRTGLRDLQDLMQKGLILRIGSRRGAIYKMREIGPNSDK